MSSLVLNVIDKMVEDSYVSQAEDSTHAFDYGLLLKQIEEKH